MIEIDPWILLAQVASFLVAVFILWRFFWGPLTRMMESRRAGIGKDIEDARKGREEVEEIKREYQAQLCGIDAKAKQILEAAAEDGKATKEEILQAAQAQARSFLDNARVEIETEKQLAMAELRKETVDLAVLIAEKILKQSVDQATRQRMLDEFIDQLRKDR